MTVHNEGLVEPMKRVPPGLLERMTRFELATLTLAR
jgi:hypothetical protein